MKKRLLILSLLAGALTATAETLEIPFGGNAYVSHDSGRGVRITKAGAQDWTDYDARVSVFFATEEPQDEVDLSLRVRGNATYEVRCGEKKFIACAEGQESDIISVGRVRLDKTGYHRVDVRAIKKGGTEKDFGKIESLILDGVCGKVTYVPADFSAHFGRRGPSIYSNYTLPKDKETAYFYNEVFVPEGEDVTGTFYMACGFGQGYFGIQTNSPTERRVLFSVWSPFVTDNPEAIPENDRVRLVQSGEDVVVRKFGGEGTGGQSFLRYPWKTETTYKLIVGAQPLTDGSTRFTGWFYATEEKRWRLIASFVRPRTQCGIQGTCSFLENFSEEGGRFDRRVIYKNQWARDTDGVWHEMTQGGFSACGTSKVRSDFEGALTRDRSGYELRICGFFIGHTDTRNKTERQATGTPPDVDIEALEKMVTEKNEKTN